MTDADPTSSGKTIEVLMVEDNPGDARLLREELAESAASAFGVTHATRLEAGLTLLAERPFDLVLLDLQLPDSAGFETFVRARAGARGVPIVVLSGTSDQTLGIAAVHEGAQDYLVKGQTPAGLLERTIRYAIERSQSSLALRESEERYRQFFKDDLAGAFIITGEGRILACNPAFVRMFGFESEEAAIGHLVIPYFPTAQDAAGLRERVRRERAVRDHQFVLRRRDGTTLHVIGNLMGRFQPPDRMIEIKGYLFDDSERKRLEEELRQSQKMESIGRLAGGIAHDFNNLLTAILGYADLLVDHFEADDVRRIEVEEIRRAGLRAAALTSQLLAFSRRQVLQPRVLDLNAVVANMKSMLQRLLGENVTLATDLAAEPCRIKADGGQIEQVIVNLAVNARDAMPSGGTLTLRTLVVRGAAGPSSRPSGPAAGPSAVLTVEDTGHGIEPALLPHLFEPFFTTKGLGKGTGLGLSTVYGIVKQSEGEIAVDSEIGRGSIFRISFPVADGPAPAAAGAPAAPHAAGSETILLVEDESAVRAITRRLLQANGYRVLEASGGGEALEVCRRHAGAIDLVLTDLMMPSMGGKELAEKIGKIHPGIRIIFMSGYTEDSLMRRELGQSRLVFLQKPFTAAALASKVRAVLDGQAARDARPGAGDKNPEVEGSAVSATARGNLPGRG